MKFSIIVPVYNVKEYLSECINSILDQDYKNYEIILVDDGSTDGSSALCDYFKRYDKIHVYHKENGGLSDARNFGISMATGEYLVFVDSDDWIAKNSLGLFAPVLEKEGPDILITCLVEIYPEENRIEKRDLEFAKYLAEGRLTKERAIRWICQRSENSFPSVKYIVRRKFVNDHHLYFMKGRLHEDMDWTSNLCYEAGSFSGCPCHWYYHRMNRKGAITAGFNKKHIIDMIQMGATHYQKLANSNDKLHRIVFERFMKSIYGWLKYITVLDQDDIIDIAKVMDNSKEIFTIAPNLDHKIFSFCMQIFGSEFVLKVVKTIYKQRMRDTK